jgi:hypothetical protein
MFAEWKNSYQSWRDSNNFSMQTRRNIAGALSLLIISLPLYLFFARSMNRGAKEERALNPKTSPLHSVYFYGVSFAGLVTAVVGGAFLLNTALASLLKTTSSSQSTNVTSVSDMVGVDSVIACGAKCDFTTDDLDLAAQWKQDWQKVRDQKPSQASSTQNDLANTIPLILVGLPLFWYHFARIRKEGQPSTPTKTA